MAEESSSRFSRTTRAHATPSPAGPTKHGGDPPAERWRSVTGGVVADCVAVTCCPCAVVNLLTLALVKAPWKVAKRCLGLGKRRRNRQKGSSQCVLVERRREAVVGGRAVSEFQPEFEPEMDWFELCPTGHLGFGRSTS